MMAGANLLPLGAVAHKAIEPRAGRLRSTVD
jgi:hypothetical protein